MNEFQKSSENLLPLQLMTDDEMRSVIRLWTGERDLAMGLHDQPSVMDLAEGLEIPASEVTRLLARVRAKQAEDERIANEKRMAERDTQNAHRQILDAQVRLAEAEALRMNAQARLAEVNHISVRSNLTNLSSYEVDMVKAPITMEQVISKSFAFVIVLGMIIYCVSSMPGNQHRDPICTLDGKSIPCSDPKMQWIMNSHK